MMTMTEATGQTSRPADRTPGKQTCEEALAFAVGGGTTETVALLGRLELEEPEALVRTLTEGSVRVLRRLQHRSQYHIPLGLVVERIPSHLAADLDLCFDFLADVALRSVGVQLPPSRRAGGTEGERVVAALVTAAGIVRFAAARWWTPVDEVTRLFWDDGEAAAPQLGSNR